MLVVNTPRRLIILTGTNSAVANQISPLIRAVIGDWVTISDDEIFSSQTNHYYKIAQAKQLLGREFKHAIFDARTSFNLDAFAMLTGTLIASSVLILLLPETYQDWHDEDSLRWSESCHSQPVPNFISHLKTVISQQIQNRPDSIEQYVIHDQLNHDYLCNIMVKHNETSLKNDHFPNYDEQQNLLNSILTLKVKMILLTAKRGRGKSALAGMFARHHHCWVSAPNKQAVDHLMHFAPKTTLFFSPDELLIQSKIANVNKPDWLIIDEAAMIPLPLLSEMVAQFNHILLTSTTDGYEGTGQGLLLKLFSQYQQKQQAHHYQLSTPVRWLNNDPLEYFIDNLIMSNSSASISTHLADIDCLKLTIKTLDQSELVGTSTDLSAIFNLLKTAHYRTTLTDFRRLLDADNLTLYCAQSSDHHIVGSLITVQEGCLNDGVIDQILKGYRRPKGNLVAQSLVAHAGEIKAAKLSSMRINRIAVRKDCRLKGIATQLIAYFIQQARLTACDFLSVSFAYSYDIYQFWSKMGFIAVHIGTHKEASSGSYSMMAIYPISSNGLELCHLLQKKLARNVYWLNQILEITLPLKIDTMQDLTDQDKLELSLFATTAYSYSASFSVLCRLANYVKNHKAEEVGQLGLLLSLVKHQFNERNVIKKHSLSGKKALVTSLRKEIYQFLIAQGFINE